MTTVADKQGLSPELRRLLTDDLNLVAQAYVPGAAAADATEEWPVFYAAQAVQIVAAYYIPSAAITGDDTNSFNLNLRNKGTDGSGTTEVGNVDFATGTDGVANDATSLGVTAFNMAAGEVLAAQREKIGTGLTMPDGIVVIVYRFR